MRFIKVLLLFVVACNTAPKESYLYDMRAACDNSYSTSSIYFDETDLLTLELRFVYFADSSNEVQPDYNLTITNLNKFYKDANIRFRLNTVDTIVDSNVKSEMPLFKAIHFKRFKQDSVITCYIYGMDQPLYSQDDSNIMGSAGGVGSTFFCIRAEYLNVKNSVVAAHELGHCFSLYHIDTPDSSADGYTIYSGDKVCDTPKATNLHEKVGKNCTYIGEEGYTIEEQQKLVCNFMTWNYLWCRHCIEGGQISRIRFYIHESPEMRSCVSKGLKKRLI